MKVSELEFFLDDFLAFCQSKNLSTKTLSSYEQSLKLFLAYLKNEHEIEKVNQVKTGHIRQYVAHIQERGKYTVVNRESSKKINFPENRSDYKKEVSSITINNYIRNKKVFFNWHHQEGELHKNPVDKITQIKTVRRQKSGINQEQFQSSLEQFDYTKFHGYRNRTIVMLLQDSGMRIGECLELNVNNIDFQQKMILLTKTKRKKSLMPQNYISTIDCIDLS